MAVLNKTAGTACGNNVAPCIQPAGSVGPDCQPAQTVDGYVLCTGRSECIFEA